MNSIFLKSIWNYVEEENIYLSTEEKKALSIVVKKEDEFVKTLSKKQIKKFRNYQDAFSELELISQQDRFVKGIKFATKYILEATKEE